MAEPIADLAFNVPTRQCYSYRIPADLQGNIELGMRVSAPLGRRTAVGAVVGLHSDNPAELKELKALVDSESLLPSSLLHLLRWAADYYCYPLGQVINSALPGGLKEQKGGARVQMEPSYRLVDANYPVRGSKQRLLLEQLSASGPLPLSRLRELCPAPHATLKRLVAVGCLAEESAERIRDPLSSTQVSQDQCPILMEAQQEALKQIESSIVQQTFKGHLLHGVTGSGKTEVYLHAVARCLEQRKQALLLVPEISLTPQLVARFRARFEHQGVAIGVLHSGLGEGERHDTWRRIKRHQVEIIIGARSALFAPLAEPGLIIVDEEHDASFKQSEGFRYHARDLALARGQQQQCPVILGSATPSLASAYRAEQGHLNYLELPRRIYSDTLPPVEIVDLKEAAPEGALSNQLIEALQETLEKGQQALLLLNRRGFAPFLLCGDCGATFYCPNCSITLTYHQRDLSLKCHYCDFTKSPDESCDKCQGFNLVYQGAGTERLEQDLVELFPGARLARMDRDTTARKGAHQQITDGMLVRDIDILIGTQMIAKGHDFPGVALVGVLDADALLNFPDFRSAERGFSLLTQVAGRAGRGRDGSGRVLVQTYNPEHYALVCALQHDYRAFYSQEMAFRRELGYPPCGHLINLILSGNQLTQVQKAASGLAITLSQAAGAVEVLGPSPCPLARLRGKSRYQILLKAAERRDVRQLLPRLQQLAPGLPRQVRLQIDVDPLDML